jgi:hypothetical protein
MLRKLHRLEYRRSLEKSPQINCEYNVILYLSYIVDTIDGIYNQNNGAKKIVEYLNAIISRLAKEAKRDLRVHRHSLAYCLKKHTKVFNWLEKNKISIIYNTALFELWTIKCLPAYVGQFRDRL